MNKKQIEAVARVCHEANRAYCRNLGDFSQNDWENLSENARESAFNGVLLYILRGGDVTPRQSHDDWIKHKEAAGWVYGETKDEFQKTHPCIVEYEDLPEAHRLKDTLFIKVCEALVTFCP
jgi:hypothetical protein